jgi:hypothetical protein
MFRQRLAVFFIACTLTLALCACGGMAGTPPAITVQPQDQSVAMGNSATFSVTATDNVNNSATKSVTFSIIVTPDSLEQDVNVLLAFGCIDNGG